jgi:hypothetical protein
MEIAPLLCFLLSPAIGDYGRGTQVDLGPMPTRGGAEYVNSSLTSVNCLLALANNIPDRTELGFGRVFRQRQL